MNYIELCSQKNHNKNHMECTLGVALLTQPFVSVIDLALQPGVTH